MQQGIKQIPREKAPRVKGGKKGGKIAATKASSSAAIAKILSRIHLSMTKKEILKFVSKNKNRSANVEEDTVNEILDILNELPEMTYNRIIDIEKEVGKLRW